MSLVINLYYTDKDSSAQKFAKKMISSRLVGQIRAKEGNERYEYVFPMECPETVLLIDRWLDQDAPDFHRKSPMMKENVALRDKYKLHLRVVQYVTE